VFDLQGKVLRRFGEPLLLSATRFSWEANFLTLAVDGEDYIYASFLYQNRIEKYTPDGRLLMMIDRVLPYPVEHKVGMEKMEIRWKVREIERLKSTAVSRGLGVDGHGRLWIMTVSKQPPANITRDAYVPQEFNHFEVYDRNGVLTCQVPLPGNMKSFDNFVMNGNSMYFLDPYGECCVFEFKVVEK